MRDVAELAGVSLATASKALSNYADVSADTRRRVQLAAAQLRYEPNLLAQSLRRSTTLTVGFLTYDLGPLLAEVVAGAEARFQEAGYSMLLVNSNGEPGLDAMHIGLLEQRRVDGLLLATADELHFPTIDRLRRLRVPAVMYERDIPPLATVGSVVSDHRSGMTAAVTHLLELGHRRIALLIGGRVRPALERIRALEETFSEHGLPPTYDLLEGPYTVEFGARTTRALLDAAEPTTAIIASVQMLIGVLEVVVERGIKLGSELSVVSTDQMPIIDLFRPQLSVIRRDVEQMGGTAAEMLVALMRGETEPHQVVLPTEFVARQSTGRRSGLPA